MPVFDAIFTASSGQSFSFGYKAGVLYSIDPIGDLPVELETSQGYQQVGATVESRSISGVTRTITGRILRNTAYLKRQLRDIFTPGATGRLTVAGKYYCDAEVQRCPAISAANLWPTFSFQLYCPNPYWRSVSETSVRCSIRSLRSSCPSAIAPTSSACASSRIFSSSATPARTRRILC